jgi:general secretion pathway protein G
MMANFFGVGLVLGAEATARIASTRMSTMDTMNEHRMGDHMQAMQTMQGRVSRVRRSITRGVTLIEVMIVVVILGLIASGVAVAVFPKFRQAQRDTTKTSAMELRRASEMWRGNHSDSCPTLDQLRSDKAIDSAAKVSDAWDSPFKILCEDDETIVISLGPDKKEGTTDDIRVPEAQTEQK